MDRGRLMAAFGLVLTAVSLVAVAVSTYLVWDGYPHHTKVGTIGTWCSLGAFYAGKVVIVQAPRSHCLPGTLSYRTSRSCADERLTDFAAAREAGREAAERAQMSGWDKVRDLAGTFWDEWIWPFVDPKALALGGAAWLVGFLAAQATTRKAAIQPE